MGEALGWPAISGSVVSSNDESWLVEIDHPFEYAGLEYRFVVVMARHEGEVLKDAATLELPCNMTRTTTERASSANPCDLSWWRGGQAMIGSVKAIAAQGGATDPPSAAP